MENTEWRLLKTVKLDLPHDPASVFLGIHPEMKSTLKNQYMNPVVIAVQFTIAKISNQSSYLSTSKHTRYGVIIIFYNITLCGIIQPYKDEWNLAICIKVNRIGSHYIKWSKLNMEFQISHVVYHIRLLKK